MRHHFVTNVKVHANRLLLNGALASFPILILPPRRRDAIALYVARLAAQCAWTLWRLEGSAADPSANSTASTSEPSDAPRKAYPTRRALGVLAQLARAYGEVVVFGAAWAYLARMQRAGVRVGGVVGQAVAFVEAG